MMIKRLTAVLLCAALFCAGCGQAAVSESAAGNGAAAAETAAENNMEAEEPEAGTDEERTEEEAVNSEEAQQEEMPAVSEPDAGEEGAAAETAMENSAEEEAPEAVSEDEQVVQENPVNGDDELPMELPTFEELYDFVPEMEKNEILNNLTPASEKTLQELTPEEIDALYASIPEDDRDLSSEYVPEDMERLIVGSDDRIVVTNPRAFPFSAICMMSTHFPCCGWKTGTGYMVDSDIMYTAAHCMTCSRHSRAADSIYLYFGYVNPRNYLYCYSGAMTYICGTKFPGGYNSQNMAMDYAVVRLHTPVGLATGWFGTQIMNDQQLSGAPIQLAGYRDGVMRTSFGKMVEGLENGTALTTADGVAGNSGSPCFTVSGSSIRAMGIYIAENERLGLNLIRRIQPDVIAARVTLQNR